MKINAVNAEFYKAKNKDTSIKVDKDKLYKHRAIAWAEEYGIVEYRIKDKYMIYNVSYPAMACEPRRTYQFKVDLDTGKTVESKQLKRYDPKGVYNRH